MLDPQRESVEVCSSRDWKGLGFEILFSLRGIWVLKLEGFVLERRGGEMKISLARAADRNGMGEGNFSRTYTDCLSLKTVSVCLSYTDGFFLKRVSEWYSYTDGYLM